MKVIKQISNRDIYGSIINYPQDSLPPYMWDRNDDLFILKPEVKELIQNYSAKIVNDFRKSNLWFRGLLMGSSIATQFYDKDTDIDIKILIDIDEFKKNNAQFAYMDEVDFAKETKDVLDKIIETGNFKFKTHPFEFFFIDISQLNDPKFIGHFDALYDVNGDRWIKKPKMFDVNTYDREQVVDEGMESAIKWATQWDLNLGKIKRHVKEFDLVNNYLKGRDNAKKQELKVKLENLLKTIENEIEELHDEKKEVTDQRHRAYIDYQDDIEKYYGMINAHPAVIQMKYLAYWGYFTIIKKMNEIVKEEDLNTNNIENVKKVIENDKV